MLRQRHRVTGNAVCNSYLKEPARRGSVDSYWLHHLAVGFAFAAVDKFSIAPTSQQGHLFAVQY